MTDEDKARAGALFLESVSQAVERAALTRLSAASTPLARLVDEAVAEAAPALRAAFREAFREMLDTPEFRDALKFALRRRAMQVLTDRLGESLVATARDIARSKEVKKKSEAFLDAVRDAALGEEVP